MKALLPCNRADVDAVRRALILLRAAHIADALLIAAPCDVALLQAAFGDVVNDNASDSASDDVNDGASGDASDSVSASTSDDVNDNASHDESNDESGDANDGMHLAYLLADPLDLPRAIFLSAEFVGDHSIALLCVDAVAAMTRESAAAVHKVIRACVERKKGARLLFADEESVAGNVAVNAGDVACDNASAVNDTVNFASDTVNVIDDKKNVGCDNIVATDDATLINQLPMIAFYDNGVLARAACADSLAAIHLGYQRDNALHIVCAQ